jgi:cell division transport system permease protein
MIGVTLVLFTVGLFGIGFTQLNLLDKALREQVTVLVELRNESSAAERQGLESYLNKQAFIKPGSLSYISKTQGLALLEKDLGTGLQELGFQNPLFDLYQFNVKAEYLSENQLESLGNSLKNNPIVTHVHYQEGLVTDLGKHLDQVLWIGAFLAIILAIVAIVLIFNTVKLSLYANRFLIKSMELVGASWGFIARPFLLKGFWMGVLSGSLALASLALVFRMIWMFLPEIQEHTDWLLLGTLGVCILILGILLNVTATWIVVKRYLRMRVEDMY